MDEMDVQNWHQTTLYTKVSCSFLNKLVRVYHNEISSVTL